MATRRETALSSLYDRLSGLGGGVKVRRNEVVPQDMPVAGLVIVRDGDPGEPEVFLSPLTYAWRHRAEVEAIVQKSPPTAAATALDTLVESIRTSLYSDRTLSGAVDYLEALAPETLDVEVEGAADLTGALIPVLLHYDTTDPLG